MDSQYDFNEEMKEFIDGKLIKGVEFLEIVEAERCKLVVTTLEDIKITAEWTVASGI